MKWKTECESARSKCYGLTVYYFSGESYGVPEKGGWYFDIVRHRGLGERTFVASKVYKTRAAARSAAIKQTVLMERHPND